jgi:uncharacterized membrane protein YhhN
VTALTVVAFVVAGVFASGDWIAKARRDLRLEYVCKPATMVALIAAALALDPAADAQTRRGWFVAALVLSLAGDVLLMLDDETRDLFVPGLAAFLLAHVCYLAGFWTDGPSGFGVAVAAVVVVALVSPFATRILAALRDEPTLRIAVAAYMAVILTMVATAVATGNVLAGVGAALFAASDTMIAWNRFVRPFKGADVLIMVTYHLGQAGLVASLLIH